MNNPELIEDEETIHTFTIDGKDYAKFSVGVTEDGDYIFYRDGISIEEGQTLDVDETEVFNHLVGNILIWYLCGKNLEKSDT